MPCNEICCVALQIYRLSRMKLGSIDRAIDGLYLHGCTTGGPAVTVHQYLLATAVCLSASVCLVIGFLMLYCMFGLFAFGSGIMRFSLLNLAYLNAESSHQALLTGHWWGWVCVCV